MTDPSKGEPHEFYRKKKVGKTTWLDWSSNSKLPPRSGYSLEAVETHPQKGAIKLLKKTVFSIYSHTANLFVGISHGGKQASKHMASSFLSQILKYFPAFQVVILV